MRICRKSLFILLLLILFSSDMFAAMEPVPPTKDVVSKSTATEVGGLDLPYKPINLDDADTDTATETASDLTATSTDESQKEKINWDQIPYIPFKVPELPSAPDPD